MSKKKYIIPIFVPHLGCPHDCIFCNQRKITNHEHAVDEEEIVNIIERHLSYFPKSDNKKEIAFFGGSFTAIEYSAMTKYLSIAKSYKDKNIIDHIRLSTRPDCIDDSILDTLEKYGVDIIELGVQSMDDYVLSVNARGHDSKSVYTASKLIKDRGFILGHQIMPGLYMDSQDKTIDSVRQSIEIGPDIVRIYPTLIVKNTVLEQLYLSGEYKPLTLDQAIDISKKIYLMYRKAEINVIRIGLQVTENINLDNDIVAGPFHSSFRQLVEQEIYYDIIKEAIIKNQDRMGEDLTIYSHKSLTSYVVGQKAINKQRLREDFSFNNISFKPSDKEDIYIESENNMILVGKLWNLKA